MSNSLKHHRSLRTIADGDIHWGRAVSLDTECYHCGLPLLHDKMDVTVFQCGKGFALLINVGIISFMGYNISLYIFYYTSLSPVIPAMVFYVYDNTLCQNTITCVASETMTEELLTFTF